MVHIYLIEVRVMCSSQLKALLLAFPLQHQGQELVGRLHIVAIQMRSVVCRRAQQVSELPGPLCVQHGHVPPQLLVLFRSRFYVRRASQNFISASYIALSDFETVCDRQT